MEKKRVCEECHHKTLCSRPCWPVEFILASGGNSAGLEKRAMYDGKSILMHFGGNKHEVRFSDLSQTAMKDVFNTADHQAVDREERERELPFEPRQKISEIFYKRFFLGIGFDELAQDFNCSNSDAASRYSAAQKRLIILLEALDGRDAALTFCDKAKKSLTKDQKAFLLNKVFGFPVQEISKLPGYGGPDWLRKKINEMYNHLMAFFPAGVPDPDVILRKSLKVGTGQFSTGVSHQEALAGVR
jgi:hypothetical protein